MEKVLVTGATGFIGLHCVQQLLEAGYAVRGTVRSLSREQEVRDAMTKGGTSDEHLELVEADLMSDAGWPEAGMAGALGVALAGPRVYGGRHVEDHWMGSGRQEARPDDIRKALRLYVLAGITCVALGAAVLFI